MKINKVTIYPKTPRISDTYSWIITEKLDGSNLSIGKLEDKLVIAQRNYTFTFDNLVEDLDIIKDKLYKGLYVWLLENGKVLLDSLNEGSFICGEWIGMGRIKYKDRFKDQGRYFIYAKARYDNESNKLFNLNYKEELREFAFEDGVVPEFIRYVPRLRNFDHKPSIEELDNLYSLLHEHYEIEGFVIENNNSVEKYVRYKNGKLQDHFIW